jgi:predicted ribosome quality control (RQC) complex YloA/Tae2 family protein
MTLDFLSGVRIRRIDMPTPSMLALTVSGPAVAGTLLLRAEPRNVALGLVEDRPTGPPAAGFTTFLRKHIEGLSVTGVREIPGGLALDLRGGPVEATLYFERTPNLVLEKEGRTIGALSATAYQKRGQKLGGPYVAPGGPGIETATSLEELLEVGARMLGTEIEADETTRRKAALRQVRRAVERLDKRIAAIEGDLEKAAGSAAMSADAQLILTCAHGIAEGAGLVTLMDPETGAERTLDLRGLSPYDAAERRFEEARRLRAGELVARERGADAARQREALEALAVRIEDDDAKIEAIEEELAALTRAQPLPQKGAKKGEVQTRLPYREIRGTGDRVILVGKSSADNDVLTTKIARPHDLWLHARGVAGSHVVVPLERTETIDSQLLVDAATLAAHFSDARGEEKVEITYVERRHVRKVKGSAPGSVNVEREKTMLLRLEPSRLARLLSNKR